MSRILQVPIVPIIARWRGARIEIIAGDPIAPGEENVVAAAAAAWLERYLLEDHTISRPDALFVQRRGERARFLEQLPIGRRRVTFCERDPVWLALRTESQDFGKSRRLDCK